jgi:non-canonical purine NTP pyrophosphatase, rdgB/HAM1 family
MALPFTTLLLATGNKGKTAELRKLLSPLGVDLADLSAFPAVEPVAETGSTFPENAELKASGYALATGMYSVADDSGLEVAALNGEPGIHSARYGAPRFDDNQRLQLLLSNMEGLTDRSARFTSSISLAAPDGTIVKTFEGECRGSIAHRAVGNNGFGYDPVFIPGGYDKTFGELTDDVKQRISHRSMATNLFIRFLLDFTGV